MTVYTTASVVGALLVAIDTGWFFLGRHTGLLDRGAARAVVQAAPAAPAAKAPQNGGADRPDRTGRLVGELRSPEEGVRRTAAIQLAHLEPVAAQRDAVREALRDVIASGTDDERRPALEALGRWGTDQDDATLIEYLSGPRAVREAAAEALAKRKSPRAAEALAKLLHDPDARFGAAVRLHQFGPAATPIVVRLLDDPDDAVKIEAAKILESIATRDEIPALQAALDHYEALANAPRGRGFRSDDPAVAQARLARDMVGPLRGAVRKAGAREGAKHTAP